MDQTKKNSLIWICVIVIEAIILQLAKSMKLWIYVILPILGGFICSQLIIPKKKQSRRNLR